MFCESSNLCYWLGPALSIFWALGLASILDAWTDALELEIPYLNEWKRGGQEDYNPIFSVTGIEASAYVLLGDVTYYLPNEEGPREQKIFGNFSYFHT